MSSLTTALTCRICGFTLTPGDRFCPSCGSPNAAIASHPENETRPFEYSQQPQHQFGFPQFSGAVTGPTPASINVNVSTTPVIIRDTGTKQYPFIVRAVWYLSIGWWLTAWMIGFAYAFAITVIGLPLTFWLLNRVPWALTLLQRTENLDVISQGQAIVIGRTGVEQRPWWIRAPYFLFIGLWLGAVWLVAAWLASVTVLLLPLGLWMFNRTSAVITLQRN